ncbi:MAG: response regulator [Phycisphaerales bacterium]|nr:response regulator [Phycisphaerales bacterium]
MATNVLVIEDDQEINALIGEYLGLENIGYHRATSGQEGISLARAVQPDVVVLDLMLPDLDGYEVCRRLKSARGTVNIPVILLTCLCQDGDRIRGFECGAFGHMAKPFQPDVLLQKVIAAVEAKRMLDSHAMFGHMQLTGRNAETDYAAINSLLADLSYRCPFDDRTTAQLREAFVLLEQGILEHAGTSQSAFAGITLDYAIRLSPAGRTDDGQLSGIYFNFAPGTPASAAFQSKTNAGKTGSAIPTGVRLGLDQATWDKFIALAGLQPTADADATTSVRVFRPIPASTLIPAIDGNVITVVASNHAVAPAPACSTKDKKPGECRCHKN